MLLLTSVGESIFQLIIVLVIFVVVLFACYYVTKWIAGYQKAQNVNRNLEVVETIKLTTNKYIQIIRAGEDKYFVIAIGKDEVTSLGTLTKDELREFDPDEAPNSDLLQLDFKAMLEKFTKKN